MPIDEATELKKKFESLKKPDPKNINKGGLVEVDRFIDLVLTFY